MRSTRWPLASCALAIGLLAACSQNKGPATNAYVRKCESLSEALAVQVRDLPRLAPPARPALQQNPTPEEQRVFDGMTRLYPLYVNQYFGAVMERCHAVSELCSQALDRIGVMDAAGIDPAGVQLMTLHVQLMDQQRQFFVELRRLADLDQSALVRRRSVDGADELLSGVFSSAMGAGAGVVGDAAAAGAVAGELKDAAGAVSKRKSEAYSVGDQVSKVAELAGRLQRDTAAFGVERARLAAGLRSKYPEQDWGAVQ